MRVLLVGDIMGRPGRRAATSLLPQLRRSESIDLIVANVENAAGGFGLTESVGKEILAAGVDVMTGGNHLWDQRGSESYLRKEPRLVRPANYPETTAGATHVLVEHNGTRVAVLNFQGQVFMPTLDCPFRALDRKLEEIAGHADVVLVDLHGEATSEKRAFGFYADGRVAAVVGTHTHVPTADEEVLPEGTAYVSDLGMTGPYDSVIGMERESVLHKFLTKLPVRFTVAKNDVRLSGLLVDIDVETGRARSVRRIHQKLQTAEVSES